MKKKPGAGASSRASASHPSQRAKRRRVAAEKLARSARVLVCECGTHGGAPAVGDLVRGFGYEVVAHHSLDDTLREATVSEFDVIVVAPPAADDEHLRLLQLLKRARPHVPLVLVTADGSLATRARLQQVGPYFVAVHPVDAAELRTALSGAALRGAGGA